MNRDKLHQYKDKLLCAYAKASKPKRIVITAAWSMLPFGLWVPGTALLLHEVGLYNHLSNGLKKCFPQLKLPDPELMLARAVVNDNRPLLPPSLPGQKREP